MHKRLLKRGVAGLLVAAMVLSGATCGGMVSESAGIQEAYAAESAFVIEDGVLTKYNGSDENVVIPSGVVRIGYGAFRECSTLKSVVIPEGVTSIDGWAFYECTNLQQVTLPEKSLVNIGYGAFCYCSALETFDTPSTVTSIGGFAFSDCTSLKSVKLPEGIAGIREGLVKNCTSLTSIYIPKSVTYIEDHAFLGCTSLKSVTGGTGVKQIGHEGYTIMYSNKVGLETTPWATEDADGLVILNNILVCYTGDDADVVIPNGVTGISSWAFFEKRDILKSVQIPNSVTSIGDYAFASCTGLKEIDIPSSVTKMGRWIFEGVRLDTLQVTGCTGLKEIADDTFWGNVNCSAIKENSDGFKMLNSILIGYSGSSADVVIPDGVTCISYSAFAGCTDIVSVTIPDSVVSIKYYAFGNCTGLKSIIGGKNVTDVVNEAFYGTPWLDDQNGSFKMFNQIVLQYTGTDDKVVVPEGTTAISGYAIRHVKEVVLPESLTRIEAGALEYCNDMESVTVPAGVTYIGEKALGYTMIDSEIEQPIPGFTIYGYLGTAAQTYASENGFRFVSLGLPFKDVQEGTWKYSVAKYVYERGIITGTTKTTFSPDSNMTRGQLVTILWRMEGSPKVSVTNTYPDVAKNKFYSTAIQWAKNNNLVSGYDNGNFGPGDSITRQQFMVIMQRYAKYKGYNVSTSSTAYKNCADYKQVSGYALSAIAWGYEKGFIGANKKLNPKASITRAEAAAILQRFLTYYKL